MRLLFDTNILIDYLNGVAEAKAVIEDPPDPAISLITWMETLAGAQDEEEDRIIRGFLNRFDLLHIGPDVAERAVEKRRRYHIRLPDAIIWATAEIHGMVLVTRNTRDFPADLPGIHVPYRL